jgi:hypothetical protein
VTAGGEQHGMCAGAAAGVGDARPVTAPRSTRRTTTPCGRPVSQLGTPSYATSKAPVDMGERSCSGCIAAESMRA